MSRWTQLSGATALACVFSASAAGADVSGEQVWGDWKDYFESFGYELTATEARDGNVLSVSDLTFKLPVPEEDSTVVISLPNVRFTDQSDGTVAMDLPPQSQIVIGASGKAEDHFRMSWDLSLTGASTIISGDPDDLAYRYTAARVALSLAELNVDDPDAPDDVQFSIGMDDLISQSSVKVGDLREISQTSSIGTISYEARIVDQSENANVVIEGSLDDARIDGATIIPVDLDLEDPNQIFTSGFDSQGAFSQAGSRILLTVVEGDQPFSFESVSGSGDMAFSIGKDGLSYIGGSNDIAMNLAGAEVPFPISLSMEELGYKFLMPVQASSEPQDFGLGLTLAGLNVPDALWNIFDPSSILERGPATMSFDIDGTARLAKNILDPSLEDSDEFPGELLSLDLTELAVKFAGTELTGSGGFTFDNSDMETFEGLPRPQGIADFRLLGGNALLDALMQMGFIGEQDALGARMMMGLFTVPGPSDDELNSRIEVTDEGHVLANGQRLR